MEFGRFYLIFLYFACFLVIVTRINSLEEAGIFTFAFSNACVFLIIGSYAGRIFQVTEMNKKITESDFLYNRLFTIGVMILSGLLFRYY